jgi:hypothetical protein
MARSWDNRRHVEIALAVRSRLSRGPALTLSRRSQVFYVAARRTNGVTVGYWRGPVDHVKGRVKPVILAKAWRAGSADAVLAALDGCSLADVFDVEKHR